MSSHLRYDHERRLTLVEVRCPKCQGKALATEPCDDEGYTVVGGKEVVSIGSRWTGEQTVELDGVPKHPTSNQIISWPKEIERLRKMLPDVSRLPLAMGK